MKAANKDIYKEIIKSKSRFLIILLIVFIGTLTYIGMNQTNSVLINTADKVTRENNLYDIRIDAVAGFTEEDKKILSSYKNIDTINYYIEEVNSDTSTLLINSNKVSGNNALSLVNTKDKKTLEGYNVIGEAVDISYLQNEINKNGIKIKQAFLVNNLTGTENVAVIKLKGTKDYKTFDKKYIEYVSKSKEEINTLLKNRPFVREKEIQDEISSGIETITKNLDKIANSFEDLNSKKIELNKQIKLLDEKKKEFEEAPNKIKEGKKKISENLNLINTKKEELNSNLKLVENGLEQIEKNYSQVVAGLEKIAEEEKKLAANETRVNGLKPSIFVSQKKIDGYKKQIEEGKKTLKEQKDKLNEVVNQKKQLEENKLKIENGLLTIKENESKILKALENINKEELNYKKNYNANLNSIKNGYKQIEEAKNKILEGSNKLSDAKEELNSKKDELKTKSEFLIAPTYTVGTRFDNFSFSALYNNSEAMKIMSIFFPLCFFVIVLFVVTTTMIRFAFEQRKAIGLYRFLGYDNKAIYKKFLTYALIPTIIGIILSSLVGTYVVPRIIYPPYVAEFIAPFNEITINFIPKYTFIIFIIFVAAIITAIVVVVKVQLKEPIVSLLIGKETNLAKRILIERFSIWKKFKFSTKILIRNLLKYKGRFIMTIVGVGGCTALIYLGISLQGSLKNITKYQYSRVRKFDATVYFKYDVTNDKKEEYINEISKYADVNRVNTETVKIKSEKFEYVSELTYLIDYKKEFFNFVPTSNATISEKTASILKLKKNDNITVYNSYNKPLVFKIDNIFENYISQYIYIKNDGTKTANAVIVKFKNKDTNINKLYNKDIVYNIISEQETKEMFDKQVGNLTFVVLFMISLGISLAIVVSYNLGNINILERKRELSTLQVLGYNWFEMRMYIFREMIILTVCSIVLGLYLGRQLQLFVADQFKVSPLRFVTSLEFEPFIISTLIILVVIFFVISVLSSKIKKIDMLEALKLGE
ncbi:FtsX-like permease family protein [Caviibacter abscessus]|uniref:FtsX-like permease family protein n=1 Tax=Caviibacter abscessus TaxID=1766719 RepID=UPI000834C96C|nr:FtsX-like permease family protein [Caviibacter abscessus]